MSRRKNSKPVRRSLPIESSECPSPSTSLRDLPHCVTKKILAEIPEDGITLGSFKIVLFPPVPKLLNPVKRMTLKYVHQDLVTSLSFHVTQEVDGGDINFLIPTSVPPNMYCVINSIISRHFIWTLKSHSSTDIEFFLVLPSSKLPLCHIKNVVNYFLRGEINQKTENFQIRSGEIEEDGPKVYEEIYIDVNDLFDEVKAKRDVEVAERKFECDKIIPTIRPYQVDAIQWMLQRELNGETTYENDYLSSVYDKYVCNGHNLYYNKYADVLSNAPLAQVTYPTGGILADDMGLGKTVEFIACVLNNPRNIDLEDNTDYLLPLLNEEEKVSCTDAAANAVEDNIAKFNNSELGSEDSDESFNPKKEIKSKRKSQRLVFSDDSDDSFNPNKERKSKQSKHLVFSDDSDSDEDYEVKTKSEKRKRSVVSDENVNSKSKIRRNKRFVEDYKRKQNTSVKRRKSSRVKEADPRDTILEPFNREKGSLREVLNSWYERILNPYSTVKTPKIEKVSPYTVKCVCGEETDIDDKWEDDGYVKCSHCETFQHSECVGYSAKCRYFCPVCWKDQKILKSNCTLIVAPTAICDQWVEEINRFVKEDAIQIYMYEGVKKEYIQPSYLASFDVVIISYNTLRKELHFTTTKSRSLRGHERFLKKSSPLTQIQWWRLCLDEAQMVENSQTSLNQMANMLHSVHRWSVTGTPVQKSLNDLFFLLEFLKVSPFCNKFSWRDCLYLPYLRGNKEPLVSVLSRVLWRNCKEDVQDQIDVPPQSTIYHTPSFSAVEEHFYRRLEESNQCKFLNLISIRKYRNNLDIRSINKQSFSSLMWPLLELRQACSHPVAVKGVFSGKECKTRVQLHEYLVGKTNVECEEAMRRHVSALNGLAGVHCINGDFADAVECYRSVLRLNEEYKDKTTVDTLQILHTLHNLAEIIEQNKNDIAPTLRDDKLREEARDLELKYMEKKCDDLKQSESQLDVLKSKVAIHRKNIRCLSGWWMRVIHILTLEGQYHNLIEKISLDMEDRYEDKRKILTYSSRISSIHGLQLVLTNWVEKIDSLRNAVLMHLQFLKEISFAILADRAVECHLRPERGVKRVNKCELCVCEKKLLEYECELFDITMKATAIKSYEKSLDGTQTTGSWRNHKNELVLRCMVNFARPRLAHCSEKWCLEEGDSHIKMLEVMKKEFKQMRTVWMELNHKAQGEDELAMCKLRLRLRLDGEEMPPQKKTKNNLNLSQAEDKLGTIHILDQCQIGLQKIKLIHEQRESMEVLKKKYCTLTYLQNLGQKPDPCPVCQVQLEKKWCVLQCGHTLCFDCLSGLSHSASTDATVKCPICRQTTPNKDFNFVEEKDTSEDSGCRPLGSHSTKVESVTREVLKLMEQDPGVKIVVFSTWTAVLDVLAVAFAENYITYRRMPGYNYKQQLQEFKDKSKDVTALFLPFAWGSKGLNLIEATHCFLVEPIMNPAEESQAISRIHRIGQTKPTVVHRFLIKGTIEEKINNTICKEHLTLENEKITINDLKALFCFNTCQI